jgi:endonuclease/exonuclease/phosphatase family metal-dependent hydrolase
VWAVVRLGGWDTYFPTTQLIAFTPYVVVGCLIPLAVVALRRHRAATVVAGVTVLVLIACVLPRSVADSDPLAGAAGPRLNVMTANVLAGRADPAALVELVRANDVDILAVQELTPGFVERAGAAGLEKLLPHSVTDAAAGVGGSGVYSRLELRDIGVRMNPLGFGQSRAEIVHYGVFIESVHPVAPTRDRWRSAWVNSFAHQPRATADGPLQVLAGDFNATLDHSVLRGLIDSGYRDAADVMGEGLIGTWGPFDGDPIPPVTLDRVLADRRIGVASVRVFDLPGSDHRPVLAALVLPR